MYAQVHQSFWTDRKIMEDCTPEERYFLLYLLSNPHGNISGVFELGFKQMSVETGYTEDTVRNLISRLQDVHNVIRYSAETREILILHWYRYNWSRSERFLIGVQRALSGIRCAEFRDYIERVLAAIQDTTADINTVCIPYIYPIPQYVNANVNDSVNVSVSVNEERTVTEERTEEEQKPSKKAKAEPKRQLSPEEEDLEDAFTEWKAFRKSIKRPVTAGSEQRARAKLENAAPGDPARQAEIIRYCIDRGWVGVFPPKKDEQTTGAKGKKRKRDFEERQVTDDDFKDLFLDLTQEPPEQDAAAAGGAP